MNIDEYIASYKSLTNRFSELLENINIDTLLISKKKLEFKTAKEGFWNDKNNAKNILKKISLLEKEINDYQNLTKIHNSIKDDFDLINLGEEFNEEFIDRLTLFSSSLNLYETKKMLNNENDHLGALLTIHPGAGGVESQDWANMLFRMYTRWCEKNNYKYKIIDYQSGDEAGIKDATIEINENYLYGLLSSESGVHRLIRISPFDSNSRRHTSFAAIFIYPIIDDDIEINVSEKDIKIDTYRASGAGGQHVNKTDSAVRITHIETKIVVQCQNQRSQLLNKQSAMKILKSKLYQRHLEEKKESLKDIKVGKKSIEWGSQIRSYTFHPYTLVKDHRTNHETSNINVVMDGDIDYFIRNYLLQRMEK